MMRVNKLVTAATCVLTFAAIAGCAATASPGWDERFGDSARSRHRGPRQLDPKSSRHHDGGVEDSAREERLQSPQAIGRVSRPQHQPAMTQRELVFPHLVDGSRPQHRQGVEVAALVHEQAGQDEHGNAAAFVAGNGSAGQELLRLRWAALPHIQAPKRMIEKWANTSAAMINTD